MKTCDVCGTMNEQHNPWLHRLDSRIDAVAYALSDRITITARDGSVVCVETAEEAARFCTEMHQREVDARLAAKGDGLIPPGWKLAPEWKLSEPGKYECTHRGVTYEWDCANPAAYDSDGAACAAHAIEMGALVRDETPTESYYDQFKRDNPGALERAAAEDEAEEVAEQPTTYICDLCSKTAVTLEGGRSSGPPENFWACASCAKEMDDRRAAEQPSRQETGGGDHMNHAHSPSGNAECRDRAKAKAAEQVPTTLNLPGQLNGYPKPAEPSGTGQLPSVPDGFRVGDVKHVALWDAVNDYAEARGGKMASVSVARMVAVARVEKAVRDILEPIAEPPATAECRCGSGMHPRHCSVHPERYKEHCDEISAESREAEPPAPATDRHEPRGGTHGSEAKGVHKAGREGDFNVAEVDGGNAGPGGLASQIVAGEPHAPTAGTLSEDNDSCKACGERPSRCECSVPPDDHVKLNIAKGRIAALEAKLAQAERDHFALMAQFTEINEQRHRLIVEKLQAEKYLEDSQTACDRWARDCAKAEQERDEATVRERERCVRAAIDELRQFKTLRRRDQFDEGDIRNAIYSSDLKP